MPIFIVKNNQGLASPVVLSKEYEHHLLGVLRKKTGDTVCLTDNAGIKALAKIQNTKPLVLEIFSKEKKQRPLPITLCVPLIAQDKLEWLVHKLCELDIETVQLITTRFCQQKNISTAKMTRLEKIAITAQKQSERTWPLAICPPLSLPEFKKKSGGYFLVGTTQHKNNSLKTIPCDALTNHKIVSVIVGPEGGFSEEEALLLDSPETVFCCLGQTVLRTETAALALTAIIKHYLLAL